MDRARATSGLLYGAVAATDTALLLGPPRWRRWRRVSKPLLVPVLWARARTSQPRPGWSPLEAAQLCSWAGDVALLGAGRGPFLGGLGAFLAGHGCYLGAFWTRSSDPVLTSPGRRWFLAAGGVASLAVAAAAGRRDRALAVPVAVYGAALVSMVAAAAAVDAEQGRARVLGGAVLFLVSDTLLGLRAFVLTEERPSVDAAVMLTYDAAQWLLCDGLVDG